jgi:hypothetical protein
MTAPGLAHHRELICLHQRVTARLVADSDRHGRRLQTLEKSNIFVDSVVQCGALYHGNLNHHYLEADKVVKLLSLPLGDDLESEPP